MTTTKANAREKDYANLLIPKGPAKTFEEHLAKTQVSKAVLKTLETVPDKAPFIMLNFMRYRPYRDPTLYMRYAMAAGDGIEVEGSYTPYYASAFHDLNPAYGFDNSWDEVTMPVYSRLASYGLAQSNPKYQSFLPDRVAGTFQRHLYVLKDGEQIFPASLTIQELHDARKGIPFKKTDVLIAEFLRFNKPDGREIFIQYAKAVNPLIEELGGEALLSVEADIPVVSEELWDHFILMRFPSLDAFKKLFTSDDFIAAGSLRRAAIEATLAVPTSQSLVHDVGVSANLISFDHVHLVSKDPKAAASWYVNKLGGIISGSEEIDGAPQYYVEFTGATITIRGQRTVEKATSKNGLQWGIDHFGLNIKNNYYAFCNNLKAKGVKFSMDPRDFGDSGSVVYIEGPDVVKIELVHHKK
jgi:uncharacterized protein (DUF1330 family)/catechol 2,3-dioxygenase-like lactoylglutathione lyase family enzyme